MMMYQFKKFYEIVGDRFHAVYPIGTITDGARLPTDVLVRQGILEVFGGDVVEQKVNAGAYEPPKRKRGRPRKVKS